MNISNHIQSVMFDVDGARSDTLPSLSAAANDVLAKAGMREVSMTLLRSALNEGLRPMLRQAITLQSAPVDAVGANQLAIEYMAHYGRRWLSTAPLFAGLTEALVELRSQGLTSWVLDHRSALFHPVRFTVSCPINLCH